LIVDPLRPQDVDNDSPEEIRASNVVIELINKRSPSLFADLGRVSSIR
jgi:hypothetical protein